MLTLIRTLGAVALCLIVAVSGQALAAEAAQSVPDKPARVTERHTPIAVEYEGNDSIGARLATRLKEQLNGSNLFTLTEKDIPKFRLLLSTVPEFSSRPGVGSAYSVVWLFCQNEATLRHFLQREVGVITPDQIDELAAKIIERTDVLAVRYGYLFPAN